MKLEAGALLSSIRIERGSGRKISVQLYMRLKDILLSGGATPGERLPASRTLAKELGVSRTTVIDAVDRLIAEGLLEARVGAGTFVSQALAGRAVSPAAIELGHGDRPGETAMPALSRAAASARDRFAPRAWLPHDPKPFITALPALDLFPMAHWSRLSARHWRSPRDSVMGYGHPFGLMALRRAIATHLNATRGIRCDPEQIFIVAGAQQAFHLIGTMLIDPGDRVWFENPAPSAPATPWWRAGRSWCRFRSMRKVSMWRTAWRRHRISASPS